nr:immunoglobulin heavy chain junction region [Mus musculus]
CVRENWDVFYYFDYW